MNAYETRQEARRQRLSDRAAALERAGNESWKRARALADCIPFGQPILVGHHSERRDRRFRAKISATYERAFREHKEAQEAARRAAAVGSGGISSDDPDAVDKLRERLAQLKNNQAVMVASNKIVRAFWKAGVRDESAGELWTRYLEKLREVYKGFTDKQARDLLAPDFAGRIGFADYALTNNSGNVRRIEQRIKSLEARAGDVNRESRVTDCGAYKVVENFGINRVQAKFPGKPNHAVRQIMKRSGFRWSPTEGAWQRMLSGFHVGFLTEPEGYLRRDITAAL